MARDGDAYVARLPRIYGRKVVGTFEDEDEAHDVLDAAIAEIADKGATVGDATLRSYGSKWLDRRELAGVRGIGTDRSRWKKHVLAAPFADVPLVAIGRSQVRAWAQKLTSKRADDRRNNGRRRKLSRKTAHECVLLLRRCLQDAVDDEIIATNPADKIRVGPATRAAKKAADQDGWTYLTADEQRALIDCEGIPERERLCIAFAIGTGLRQGEQWNLELADVHVAGDEPHIMVRYGGPGHAPPKNGKIRRVPLFGIALDAAKRWLAIMKATKHKNRFRLMWPTVRGYRRQKSKTYGFADALASAGIVASKRHDKRHVRWHDLRHTAASSLVAGWWGERWTLDEVRSLLGHSSVTVTERYAHLAPSVLQSRARRTVGARRENDQRMARITPIRQTQKAGTLSGSGQLRGQDLNLRPSGYEPDELPDCSTAQDGF